MSPADIAKEIGCTAQLVYNVRGAMGKSSGATQEGKRAGRPADSDSKSGRIRALLGSGLSAAEIADKVGATTALVYAVKSASGKTAGGKPSPRVARRAPASAAEAEGLAGIVEAVRNSERERARLRAVLEKLQAQIAEALA